MPRSALPFFAFPLVTLLLTGGVACDLNTVRDDDNFRSTVIYCESAVEHAVSCCPGLRAHSDACFQHYERTTRDCGCSGSGSASSEEGTEPLLTIASSEAILGTSCDALAANDGCDRLAEQLSTPKTHSSSQSCSD
jgi:hypothetical protein